MCFFHDDYDWRAEVRMDSAHAEGRDRCDECRSVIHHGQWRRETYMRQHEMCRKCEDPDSCDYVGGDDEDGPPETCPAGECDYGETFEYTRCESCDKLLRAIEAAEIEEGCSGDETRPALTELREAMTYDEESSERYVAKAMEMFPELAASGYLDRLVEWFDPEDGWSQADLDPVEELGWGG